MAPPAEPHNWLVRLPGFQHALACIALVVLTAGTFANALRNEFVDFDDFYLIERNLLIRSLSPEGVWQIFSTRWEDTWLPLRALSYAVDYHFWGLNAFGYHLTNVALHAANVLLVYALLVWLLRRPLAACFGAALFAVHPVQVAAVTWASGRRDVLYAFFFLLSYLLFLAQERAAGRRRWVLWGASIACIALSMLSKASGMMLPAVLLLTIVLFDRKDESLKRRVWLCVPHGVVCLGLVGWHLYLASAAEVVQGGGLIGRLPSVPWVFAAYWRLLFFPINLLTPYAASALSWKQGWLIGASAAGVVAVIAAAWWALPRPRIVLFCLGWWFLMLLPFSNLVQLSMLVADRYLYLPIFGACAFAAALLGHLAATKARGIVVAVCAVAILGLLAGATHYRNRVWENPPTFWRDGVSKMPDQPVHRVGLGVVYLERGRPLRGWHNYMTLVLRTDEKQGEAYSAHPSHVELSDWGVRNTYTRIARRWEAAGRLGDALEIHELARDRLRNEINVRLGFAKAYLRQDMDSEARLEMLEVKRLYEEAPERNAEAHPRLRKWLESRLGMPVSGPDQAGEPAEEPR